MTDQIHETKTTEEQSQGCDKMHAEVFENPKEFIRNVQAVLATTGHPMSAEDMRNFGDSANAPPELQKAAKIAAAHIPEMRAIDNLPDLSLTFQNDYHVGNAQLEFPSNFKRPSGTINADDLKFDAKLLNDSDAQAMVDHVQMYPLNRTAMSALLTLGGGIVTVALAAELNPLALVAGAVTIGGGAVVKKEWDHLEQDPEQFTQFVRKERKVFRNIPEINCGEL